MKNRLPFFLFTLFLLGSVTPHLVAQNEQHSILFINQLGFMPKDPKFFTVVNPITNEFQIVQRERNGKSIYTGKLTRVDQDLGEGWVGDFSAVQAEGNYMVVIGNQYAQPTRCITIYPGIYKNAIHTLFNYYGVQRCGDSGMGWNNPCHTNDAKRADTGEHVDVAGGWHQSCDLRKWTFGTSHGLIGLSQLMLLEKPLWGKTAVQEELRWGNQYFQKMVTTNGMLMDHVVLPLGWAAERDLYANEAPGTAIYTTLIGEAMAAQAFSGSDPAYSKKCLEVAQRMWNRVHSTNFPTTPYNPPVVPRYHEWMPPFFSQNYPGSALGEGGALLAGITLYRASGDTNLFDVIAKHATTLTKLQVGGDVEKDLSAACFRVGPGKTNFACASYDGGYGPIGLCEAIKLLPKHPDVALWRTAVERIAKQNCLTARRNAWGLIAPYWYAENPGGGHAGGSGYYRYFYLNPPTGINLELLMASLFLLRAEAITGDHECRVVACRQLDFVLGCNPAMASTVEGVGRNQPERLINVGEFFPPVPQIPGAVMTGMCGDERDNPVNFHGGLECEYDMPPNAIMLWLMGELGHPG